MRTATYFFSYWFTINFNANTIYVLQIWRRRLCCCENLMRIWCVHTDSDSENDCFNEKRSPDIENCSETSKDRENAMLSLKTRNLTTYCRQLSGQSMSLRLYWSFRPFRKLLLEKISSCRNSHIFGWLFEEVLRCPISWRFLEWRSENRENFMPVGIIYICSDITINWSPQRTTTVWKFPSLSNFQETDNCEIFRTLFSFSL